MSPPRPAGEFVTDAPSPQQMRTIMAALSLEKKRKPRLVLCILFITLCVMAIPVHSQNVTSFAIPSFSNADLLLFYFSGESSFAVEQGVVIPDGKRYTTGRFMYKSPVQFYGASSGIVASFRTSFVFSISPNSTSLEDGLAFVIAPTLEATLSEWVDGGLGLFDYDRQTGEPMNGPSNLVAIEIDTFQGGVMDPGHAPHVGLDINSLKSIIVSTRSSTASSIKIGSSVGVWIEYSAPGQEITVRMSVTSYPAPPTEEDAEVVLTYSRLNLSAWIVESSYIGFSTSTGSFGGETNILSAWNFSTTLQSAGGTPTAPLPPPPPSPLSPPPASPLSPPTPSPLSPPPPSPLSPPPPSPLSPPPPSPLSPPPPSPLSPPPPSPLGTGSSPPLDPPLSPPPLSNFPLGAGRSHLGAKVILLIVLPTLALVLALVLCFYLRWRHKNRPWRKQAAGLKNGSHQLQLPEAGYGPRGISYNSLMIATKDFSTILGEGGCGGVYKGVLLDGSEVAVKRIKTRTQDGEKQFLAEVTTIGRLSHRNLVPLKGWCHENDQLLIVYEYMPNGSLADHLYPEPTEGTALALNWRSRLNIIRGVADALLYLHGGWNQSVVHRDIKPSNVMLDANFVPKLGDFGFAVAMKDYMNSRTSVSRAAGTGGYLAPECVLNHKVGPDSDVYSFGVLVLEVVCGRKPFDWRKPENEILLVDWVWSLYIANESLMGAVCQDSISADCKEEEAEMLLRLGLMCTFPNPSSRPKMRTVTQFLEGSLKMPQLPREAPPHSGEPTQRLTSIFGYSSGSI